MAAIQEPWEDLASKVSALGLKLKLHYEQERGEGPDGPAVKLHESAQQLGDAIEDAFESFGRAVEDDAVRQDVKDAGQLFVDAISNTFSEVSDEIRDAVRRQ